MSIGETSMLDSASHGPVSGTPRIWAHRWGSAGNFVVLAGDEIAVGTIPRAKFQTARELLAMGISVADVLGAKATYIPVHSVRALRARLNRNELHVEYNKSSKETATCRFAMQDRDALVDLLAAVRDRMPPGAKVVERTDSRLFHILKPLNLLILFVTLAGGAHWYYAAKAHAEKLHAVAMVRKQEAREKARREPPRFHQASPRPYTRTPVAARMIARNPAMARAFVLVIGVAAAVGTLLDALGYMVTMTLLFGGALAAAFWLFSRIANPPATVSLLAGRRV